MPPFEDDVPLVFFGRAQETEERNLGGVHRVNEVLPAAEQENRNMDPRSEVQRLNLGRPAVEGEPAGEQHGGLEAALDGNERQGRIDPRESP